MSRIETTFARLKEQQRKALIPFITAGDPALEITVPLMRSMVEAGADVIELGVPFSDPMADGPVIQKACERALAAGTGLPDVLAMVREFRRGDDTTPVVLMGYLNPVECMGYERFAETCAEVGVDGVLLVDLPPEECDEIAPLFKERGVDLIFLVAPTTTDTRIGRIADGAGSQLRLEGCRAVRTATSVRLSALWSSVDLALGGESCRACRQWPTAPELRLHR